MRLITLKPQASDSLSRREATDEALRRYREFLEDDEEDRTRPDIKVEIHNTSRAKSSKPPPPPSGKFTPPKWLKWVVGVILAAIAEFFTR